PLYTPTLPRTPSSTLFPYTTLFRSPECRRVQYVTLAQRDFLKPVPDADVQTYYTEHVKEFDAPRQARVAHELALVAETGGSAAEDRKSTRLNSSHLGISYAVFCLKK